MVSDHGPGPLRAAQGRSDRPADLSALAVRPRVIWAAERAASDGPLISRIQKTDRDVRAGSQKRHRMHACRFVFARYGEMIPFISP